MEGRKVKQAKMTEEEEDTEEQEEVKPPTREEAFHRQVSIFNLFGVGGDFLMMVMVHFEMTASKQGVCWIDHIGNVQMLTRNAYNSTPRYRKSSMQLLAFDLMQYIQL